jgi:hypothetical protein
MKRKILNTVAMNRCTTPESNKKNDLSLIDEGTRIRDGRETTKRNTKKEKEGAPIFYNINTFYSNETSHCELQAI